LRRIAATANPMANATIVAMLNLALRPIMSSSAGSARLTTPRAGVVSNVISWSFYNDV
jgi:hypothetical protein